MKNCLFGATNIVKNNDGEKYVYSSYGWAFGGKDSSNFNDGFAKNVSIFGVDNSSSSHTDNLKNDFLILGKGNTFGNNGCFGASEKKVALIFLKQRQSFVWVCIIMMIIVTYL